RVAVRALEPLGSRRCGRDRRRDRPRTCTRAHPGDTRRVNIRERLAKQPAGYDYTIGRVLMIYAGLMVTLLLAALDQTIVATALPKIVSDLGGITQYSWVFTAYMLTSTVSVPVYGRLGDVHGRRPLMLIAVTIFLVGSALCGAAQNMPELVVFRGIQGLGAGGLFPLSLAVIGGLLPPPDPRPWPGPHRAPLP